MVKSISQTAKDADRLTRVKRTTAQFAIVAFVAIYPLLIGVSDLDALVALLPTIGITGLGAIVTDIYNRVRPAE